MTGADRLIGLAFVVPVLLLTVGYGFRQLRRGRVRWPWALPVGVALLGAGLLVPWLPLAFAGVAVMTVDVYEAHLPLGRRGSRRQDARRPPRRRADR